MAKNKNKNNNKKKNKRETSLFRRERKKERTKTNYKVILCVITVMHEGISDKNIETSCKGMILDYIAISRGDGDR